LSLRNIFRLARDSPAAIWTSTSLPESRWRRTQKDIVMTAYLNTKDLLLTLGFTIVAHVGSFSLAL